MDNQDNKIESAFKAPDGYLEGFEKTLQDRISNSQHRRRDSAPKPAMKVTHRKFPIAESIAVAATVSALLMSAYFVFFKGKEAPMPEVAKVSIPTPEPMAEVVDSVMAVNPSEALVESILENPDFNSPVASKSTLKLTRADAAVAAELDAAGLIAMDIDDGLFDTFEL